MDHFQVKVSEVDEPVGLSTVESLGETEVGEVCVIGKDLYREWGSIEVGRQDFRAWMTVRSSLL